MIPPFIPIEDLIKSGRVLGKIYSWNFFYSGVAQVKNTVIDPAIGIFTLRLSNGVFLGLFREGLHIGEVRVPYLDELAVSLLGFDLPVYAPSFTQ